MQDVRLLTLYKQHYMDKYDGKLDSDYSCWGYYDGMDIVEVESKQYSTLFPNGLCDPVSDLWYKTGEKIGQITGQFGCLHIGLFRSMEDQEQKIKDFWCENEKMLFFGVAFLQLDVPEQYQDFSKDIEMMVLSKANDQNKCSVVTYCTFDNADLVLLIHSNSLHLMEYYLQEIEARVEVRYQHSILGVSEKYLEDCEQNKVILSNWKGESCFIDETVLRLDLHLVTSGEKEIVKIEKDILDEINVWYNIKNFEEIQYSYVSGHENLIISLENTDIRSMLIFLLPGSFATHQNESYAEGIDSDTGNPYPRLFNITTTYILESNSLNSCEVPKKVCRIESSKRSHNWFQIKICEYKRKLGEAFDDGDESLYSYYLALLRTLNTLVQYERFGLSEDIFYLLYPSFKMFDEKLNRSLNEARQKGEMGKYNPYVSDIKQALCEYIESVNSVIYHTIHTDQIYLMIPGYSGTSFSIPIKLNMLFLWFTDCVAQLLGNDGRKYRCILVPSMELKPVTEWLRFECSPSNFLVCVKISQRSLYMPESLMIILAHEMGHYIGGNLRCRQFRAEMLAEYMAGYLTDIIWPKDKIDKIKKEILYTLHDRFEKEVELNMKKFLVDIAGEAYGDVVIDALLSISRNILSECREINNQNITNIYSEEEIDSKPDFFQIVHLLEWADKNAQNALISDQVIRETIETELKVYKETFSDMIAIRLLQCDRDSFKKAFLVSEGVNVRSEEARRRENAMAALGDKVGWEITQDEEPVTPEDKLLNRYLIECDKWINKKLRGFENTENEPMLQTIRELYEMFKQTDTSDSEYQKIYDTIIKYIQKMKEDINDDIEKLDTYTKV